jgi:hypothetical protein
MRTDAIFVRRSLVVWLFLLGFFSGAFQIPSVINKPRWSTFNSGHTFLHRQLVLLSARNRLVASTASTQQVTLSANDETTWYPRASKVVYDDDIYGATEDEENDGNHNVKIEERGVKLLAKLLQERLEVVKSASSINTTTTVNATIATDNRHAHLVKGRFIDLTCTEEGERILEALFLTPSTTEEDDPHVIQAAVMAMQSILVLGTQVGVKGSPVQLQQMVAHLDSRGDQQRFLLSDLETWDTSSVRRLKYQQAREPGSQALTELHWKRNTQGAFDLLVAIGAWGKHEDLALLRSGFSVRFNDKELLAVTEVSSSMTFTGLLCLLVPFDLVSVAFLQLLSVSRIHTGPRRRSRAEAGSSAFESLYNRQCGHYRDR